MAVFRIEILPTRPRGDGSLAADLREAGIGGITAADSSPLFFVEGSLTGPQAEVIARGLLTDPVVERFEITAEGQRVPEPSDAVAVEVHLRPGVMDPVAQTTLAELQSEGIPVDSVRTARRYVVRGEFDSRAVVAAVARVVANDCIEEIVPGSAGVRGSPRPPVFDFQIRTLALRGLTGPQLERLSRDGHLFLSLDEMYAVQAHFEQLGRDPTDLELETLAQTWSEHCVHKTMKSAVVYRGDPMPAFADGQRGKRPNGEPSRGPVEIRYSNLLADTIARATRELMAAKRGPECLSVFRDNAGVIGFDDRFGLAFKVETHNHPSAIEPYGGAATGAGGCIRDVIGCGLGAQPIANTDVFCVAPGDWPAEGLPQGVLPPARTLRSVVQGVADYGNRMGIPTVNGAVYFDPRYLGNPLVFCGCVGLIPRDRIEKNARAGDLIVLVGGRTGRDGIHGATFSSAELTDTHADEFSHAVQIGNAITEKRFMDAVLRARDDARGCLYTAITDCGAGGLSSAVGEMGESIGAVVDLERVPLKYAGLRYDEIWISEAQERMVLAVPPANLDRLFQIMAEEEVEATVIGTFGSAMCEVGSGESPRGHTPATPRLVVRYRGTVVGSLDMHFLHEGLPRREREAEWSAARDASIPHFAFRVPDSRTSTGAVLPELLARLRRPAIASKEWLIRRYDHEVQGGSVVKPLCGPGTGPSDAAVLRPRLDSYRGVAVGCGFAPHLSDLDPYWVAIAGIDEAVRNVVCVGGDPAQTAILDNFCWGRTDDPRQLGGLVRACQACYVAAAAYGVPFISGKDSLNNEFALDQGDLDRLITVLHDMASASSPDAQRLRTLLPALVERIRRTGRLSIPGTLLISALSLIQDVRRCITPDLKQPGREIWRVGGLPLPEFTLAEAARTHAAVASAIEQRLVTACHDVSDDGWLVAAAEMAIAGNRGIAADFEWISGSDGKRVSPAGPKASFATQPAFFDEVLAGYVVETADAAALKQMLGERQVRCLRLGKVAADDIFSILGETVSVGELRVAWSA